VENIKVHEFLNA